MSDKKHLDDFTLYAGVFRVSRWGHLGGGFSEVFDSLREPSPAFTPEDDAIRMKGAWANVFTAAYMSAQSLLA